MLKFLIVALAMSLTSACATPPPVTDAVRSELAPSGKLRAGMNLGNALFTQKDPANGALRGVSVDLMRELGSRLGVPVEFVVYETPGQVADAAESGAWDVAVLAIEQARARTIAFSPAMTEIEATYVVHKDSPLRAAAQVDGAGVRIAASEKAGYELYLTRTVRNAILIRPKGFPAAVELFNARGADALAALKPQLLESMAMLPEARMVEGNFMIVNHGLGTPRNRPTAAAYLQAFVTDLVASGFIARSIAASGVQGLAAVK
ncbi:ABC transporter substrate-binding protein [Ramlibacter monticola]|uniref:Transporter substrate-binding domain-containing protein n=1 Tax=Ramlibacter monticola TaxID=1926872 RepID=A0A937CS96_9BURK|nr:transporter substrate-binding domain-containing protein [Ramlibacter monticola]MBL0390213.1 transporter substrate-binding domain-containing protein [Ramlibacter monticola]